MGGPIFLPKPEKIIPKNEIDLVVNWRDRMDEILVKIFESGFDSLTDEENVHLQVYSKKCKAIAQKEKKE